MTLALWPRPHRQERLPGACPDQQLQEQVDPQLPAEGYQLHIENRIRLRYADAAGRRHGRASLAQLRQADGSYPCCRISDAPAVPVRGLLLDVSRDRVPTNAQLREVIDLIAALKGNHLQLYFEHSFAYARHPAVWRDASPLLPQELQALDAYAAARGVEVSANQNCFGHFERWLQLPAYAHLGECSDVAARLAAGAPGPFSLCPEDPAALALVRELLDELLPCLRSAWVNIGGDETLDVGQGRSRAAVQAEGAARVYGRYLAQVAAQVRRHGKRPQFWADMALDDPAILAQLPPEALALAWGYEAESDFASWAELLRADGRAWWACPGSSSWRSILGRSHARQGSIRAALAVCGPDAASGLLLTDWGDLGHRQQWPLSMLALAEGLGAAWMGRWAPDSAAIDQQVFAGAPLSAWLDAAGHLEDPLRDQPHPLRPGRLSNAGPLFVDGLLPWERQDWLGDLAAWEQLAEAIAAHAAALPALSDTRLQDECRQICADARLHVRRALLRRQGGTPAALRRELDQLIARHRQLWLARSRPGGLSDSCAHYRRLLSPCAAGGP